MSFFGPFYGPYWITQLYGDATLGYEVAAIYSCTSVLGFEVVEDFWILSRTRQLPATVTYQDIVNTAEKQGIDFASLNVNMTYQGEGCTY